MIQSFSSNQSANSGNMARQRERASSAYRDNLVAGGLENSMPQSVLNITGGSSPNATSGKNQAVVTDNLTCEISEAELKDLQTTVQINKDIIKSLIEAQQSTSPNHSSLK